MKGKPCNISNSSSLEELKIAVFTMILGGNCLKVFPYTNVRIPGGGAPYLKSNISGLIFYILIDKKEVHILMMVHMKHLTLFKRLVLSYLAVLVVVIALGVYSTSKLDEMSQIIHSISTVDSETKSLAGSLKDSVLSQSALEKKYIVSS